MCVEGHTREVAGSAMDEEAGPRPSVWSRLGVLGGAATLSATTHCSDLFCQQVKCWSRPNCHSRLLSPGLVDRLPETALQVI